MEIKPEEGTQTKEIGVKKSNGLCAGSGQYQLWDSRELKNCGINNTIALVERGVLIGAGRFCVQCPERGVWTIADPKTATSTASWPITSRDRTRPCPATRSARPRRPRIRAPVDLAVHGRVACLFHLSQRRQAARDNAVFNELIARLDEEDDDSDG